MAAILFLNPTRVQQRSHKPQMLVVLPGFHGDSSVFMEALSEEADNGTQHIVFTADVMALVRINLQKDRGSVCTITVWIAWDIGNYRMSITGL